MLNSTNEVPVDQRSCSCAIAGNNWLAKRSLAMKASTHLNACSGTSTAPDSLMIGACGQSRLILYSNFLPVHLGHSGLSGGLDKLRDGSRMLPLRPRHAAATRFGQTRGLRLGKT